MEELPPFWNSSLNGLRNTIASGGRNKPFHRPVALIAAIRLLQRNMSFQGSFLFSDFRPEFRAVHKEFKLQGAPEPGAPFAALSNKDDTYFWDLNPACKNRTELQGIEVNAKLRGELAAELEDSRSRTLVLEALARMLSLNS